MVAWLISLLLNVVAIGVAASVAISAVPPEIRLLAAAGVMAGLAKLIGDAAREIPR